MSFEEMKNTLIHNCIGMYLVMSSNIVEKQGGNS